MSHNRSNKPIKQPDSSKNETTSFSDIPNELVEEGVWTYLDAKSEAALVGISKGTHNLFQPQMAASRLLSIIANYKLSEAEVKRLINKTSSPESKEQERITNPILLAVDEILEKNPALALIKGPVKDPSRSRFESPLEYAYWSGNFFVCKMILEKIKRIPEGEKEAFAQIRAMQEKATNYDIELMPTLAVGKTPDSSLYSKLTKPTLIKYLNAEGDPKMSFWGDLNGRWQLTELGDVEQALFSQILFPPSGSAATGILPQRDITPDMFATLKKYHTVSQYDPSEFTRKVGVFMQEYPADEWIAEELRNECDADALELIGMTQKYFPAWIAQLWQLCGSFFPSPNNFSDVITSLIARPISPDSPCLRPISDWLCRPIAEAEKIELGLVILAALKMVEQEDDDGFYESSVGKLGENFLLQMTSGWVGVRENHEEGGLGFDLKRECGENLPAMAALCELMKVEFEKINQQLLAYENSLGISSKVNLPRKP